MKYNFELDLDTRNSLSIIVNRIKSGSTVLEFGPANGRMTKYLKEKLDCKIYAVELDQSAAQNAEKFCEKILVEDIENYNWLDEYKLLSFDYIIFTDILEHLYYPEKTLQKAKSLLSDNGSILISIPNVSHNAIIMDLLNDRFTYRDIGLLDNTHIRFFTKKTLDELISQCGLEVEYETGSYVNPKQTEFQYSYSRLDDNLKELLSNRKYGEVYQFVFEAKKNVENPVSEFKQEEMAVLYIDTGTGFNEAEKELTFFIYEEDKSISFQLEQCYDNVKSIRIDLFKNPLELGLNNLYINKSKFKGEIRHNGCKKRNNILIFLHDEPQITVNFEKNTILESVTLDIKYLKKIFNIKERQLIEERKLKNQIKKIIPGHVKNKIKSVVSKLIRWQYLAKKILPYIRMNGIFFTLKQIYNTFAYSSKGIVFKSSNIDTQNISCFKEKISIVIPTYNGLKDLRRLIPQLINQKGFNEIDIIIVDSSSQDKTKAFVKQFPNVKFISIPQDDFSHSYARNLGFENTNSDFVLFFVQDAMPSSDFWLYTLVKILIKNDLVALSCTQLVNAEADLYTCYGIDKYNEFLGLTEQVTKISEKYINNNPELKRKLSQLDNVACLFKSEEFSKYQFRGKYAEDLDIGLRLIKDNYRIGMTSEIQVIHSHLRPAFYYMKRAMVETNAINEILENDKDNKVFLADELSDILSSYLLLGNLLSELKKTNIPLSFCDFQVNTIKLLENLSLIDYSKNELIYVNKYISEFDINVVRIVNVLFEKDILIKKGVMHSSMMLVVHDVLSYMESRFEIVDEHVFTEFCLFLLDMFSANVGARFGDNYTEYKKQFYFMHDILSEMEKGV